MSAVEDVTLPKWGMTMQEGTLASWQAEVGDAVKEGQVIATIATEKVDADLESPVAGTLSEIVVPEGETVPVGAVVARITTG